MNSAYRIWRTHGNVYWTLSGTHIFVPLDFLRLLATKQGLLLLNIGWVYGIYSRVPFEVAII
jgi:hypothetical protein